MEITLPKLWIPPTSSKIAAEKAPDTQNTQKSGNLDSRRRSVCVRIADAIHRFDDAQGTRCRSHGMAVHAYDELLSSQNKAKVGALFDAVKLAALQDARDGVVLSEAVDLPREKAATNDLFRLFNELANMPPSDVTLPEPMSLWTGKDGGETLGEVWKQLADMIAGAQAGNLAETAGAAEAYTDLYKNLANITAQLDKWMHADGDNAMKLDVGELRAALQKLLDSYKPENINNGDLKPKVVGGKYPEGGLSRAEADELCDGLGLPKDCVKQNAKDGSFYVIPDLSQIQNMLNNLPGNPGDTDVSLPITVFNSWKQGFDSQISRFEDDMQSRGQKYSNAYSRFENFHKTISSIIQTMADMLRHYLQF